MSRSLRIVIVTGQQARHLNLCGTISSKYDVVGVIHPRTTYEGATRLSRLWQQSRNQGLPLTMMRLLAVTGGPWYRASRQPAERDYPGVDAYNRIPADRIFPDVALSDSGAVDLLKSLRPDATICLGGPICPGAFIGASPVTLNFHSGISPIYNGSSSAEFAFANGHPHLCGGTLMKMNAVVDGGEILAHFLPAVERGDSPSSLFAKIVMGAATTYDRVLAYMSTHGSAALTSVPQPKPLFQTRGAQLGWYQSTMIERFWRKDIASQATRGEEIIEYWNAGNAETARQRCHQTIDRLLWAGRF